MKLSMTNWAAEIGVSIGALGCTIVGPPARQSDASSSAEKGGSSSDSPSSDNGSTSKTGDADPGTAADGTDPPLPAAGQLFSPSSPWNTPATGKADPRSDTMITSLKTAFVDRGNGFEIAGLDSYPD